MPKKLKWPNLATGKQKPLNFLTFHLECKTSRSDK